MNTLVEKTYYEFKISKGIKLNRTKKGHIVAIKRRPRRICAPYGSLKILQKEILNKELSKIKLHKCAYGFIQNRAIQDNAKQHINSKSILSIDMKDFFTTITEKQVLESLVNNGIERERAEYIANICTYKGVLPQGAPTSPTLSNIVAKPMDKKLYSLCKEKNMKYTRYADDISISAEFVEDLLEIKPKVFSIINSLGWKISGSKVNIVSRNNPSKHMKVTGIIVNKRPNIDRKKVLAFRSLLHHIECDIKNGLLMNQKQLEKKYKPLNSLLGYANFLYQTNPKNEKYLEKVKNIKKVLT